MKIFVHFSVFFCLVYTAHTHPMLRKKLPNATKHTRRLCTKALTLLPKHTAYLCLTNKNEPLALALAATSEHLENPYKQTQYAFDLPHLPYLVRALCEKYNCSEQTIYEEIKTIQTNLHIAELSLQEGPRGLGKHFVYAEPVAVDFEHEQHNIQQTIAQLPADIQELYIADPSNIYARQLRRLAFYLQNPTPDNPYAVHTEYLTNTSGYYEVRQQPWQPYHIACMLYALGSKKPHIALAWLQDRYGLQWSKE